MKIIDASFMQSAQSIKDSPSPDVAEVAFIGRSNVGKSSLLNTLTHRKNLAKSSSTPGKTQLLNYFNIKFKSSDEESQTPYVYARFVDLPGFGYARVSKTLKEAWNKNLTGYLQSRPCLQIFIHLIDARHPHLEIDVSVDEFLNTIKRPDQIIIHAYTKTDKLKKNDLNKLKQKDPEGIFISNLKKTGMDKLEQTISEYLFGN